MTAAAVCILLTTGLLAFLWRVRPDPADLAPHRSQLDRLLERRDTIYENLRDLRFEYRAGKFSEEDYERTRQALEREAAMVLAEIERLTQSPASVTTRQKGR
jgi:hypothetical protein